MTGTAFGRTGYRFSGTTEPIPGIPVSQSLGPPVPERPESVGRSVSTQEHSSSAERTAKKKYFPKKRTVQKKITVFSW